MAVRLFRTKIKRTMPTRATKKYTAVITLSNLNGESNKITRKISKPRKVLSETSGESKSLTAITLDETQETAHASTHTMATSLNAKPFDNAKSGKFCAKFAVIQTINTQNAVSAAEISDTAAFFAMGKLPLQVLHCTESDITAENNA